VTRRASVHSAARVFVFAGQQIELVLRLFFPACDAGLPFWSAF
jgi:hypothetical protein